MHDAELWQVFLDNGQPASEALDKQFFKEGRHICGASHVWMWRRRGDGLEILLQRRADDKPTWPGYVDISAAGHINEGESPIEAALREAQEEIGVSLDKEKLTLLFVSRKQPPVYKEIDWVYAYDAGALSFSLSDGEVASLEWVGISQFLRKIDTPEAHGIVPHHPFYFQQLAEYFKSL